MNKKVTGGVAIINTNNKHLLIKQSTSKPLGGQWRHPGGSFGEGESAKEGIKREIKEEIGLKIKVLGNKPIYIEKIDYKPGYFGFYKASIIGGKLKIDRREIDDYGWFTIEEIKNLDLMKATKSFYKKRSQHWKKCG